MVTKTTLNIDAEVLQQAKARAAQEGTTLTRFVEEALRARLLPAGRTKRRFRLDVPIVRGHAPPKVDVSDREALYDLLDR